MRDDRARLEDILQAISSIARYASRGRLAFEVPWPRVIGMRNILVHGYFAIDLEEVWVTVERRVPVLQNQIEAILQRDTEPPTLAEHRPAYRLALELSR